MTLRRSQGSSQVQSEVFRTKTVQDVSTEVSRLRDLEHITSVPVPAQQQVVVWTVRRISLNSGQAGRDMAAFILSCDWAKEGEKIAQVLLKSSFAGSTLVKIYVPLPLRYQALAEEGCKGSSVRQSTFMWRVGANTTMKLRGLKRSSVSTNHAQLSVVVDSAVTSANRDKCRQTD